MMHKLFYFCYFLLGVPLFAQSGGSEISVREEALTASLTLKAGEVGVIVYVNNNRVATLGPRGQTTVKDLPVGKHKVTFVDESDRKDSEVVMVEYGKDNVITSSLKRTRTASKTQIKQTTLLGDLYNFTYNGDEKYDENLSLTCSPTFIVLIYPAIFLNTTSYPDHSCDEYYYEYVKKHPELPYYYTSALAHVSSGGESLNGNLEQVYQSLKLETAQERLVFSSLLLAYDKDSIDRFVAVL